MGPLAPTDGANLMQQPCGNQAVGGWRSATSSEAEQTATEVEETRRVGGKTGLNRPSESDPSVGLETEGGRRWNLVRHGRVDGGKTAVDSLLHHVVEYQLSHSATARKYFFFFLFFVG